VDDENEKMEFAANGKYDQESAYSKVRKSVDTMINAMEIHCFCVMTF